jgi:MSHA biogenesis protein MshM
MYLEHFGLHQAPFRITPHTEFFFAGGKRGATLEALIYAITHDEGIVKVSGEVGSGKTMLCRMLLEKLPDNVETVYLSNPLLSRDEILFAIAEELRIPLAEGRNHLLLRSLQERLLEIYGSGRQVVALIDEAHAMPPEALEEIRLLSNLESNRHKLLQIVLFGQPELDSRLRQTSMRQLNDRITHNFRLEPLRRSDVSVYLLFRLRAAGYRGPDPFTKGAVELISKASEGLSRRINILADKALLAAFSEGVHQVDRRQVRAAIRDVEFRRLKRRFGIGWAWAGAAARSLRSGRRGLSRRHAEPCQPWRSGQRSPCRAAGRRAAARRGRGTGRRGTACGAGLAAGRSVRRRNGGAFGRRCGGLATSHRVAACASVFDAG